MDEKHARELGYGGEVCLRIRMDEKHAWELGYGGKYVRDLGWMRNVDAKDGSRVMMDEKYGWEECLRIKLDEKCGCKGWFTSYDGWEVWMRNVWELSWMRNMDAKDGSQVMMDEKYVRELGWTRSMFQNDDGWEAWFQNEVGWEKWKQRMVRRIMMDDKHRWEIYDGW